MNSIVSDMKISACLHVIELASAVDATAQPLDKEWDANAGTRHQELVTRSDPAYRALTNLLLKYLSDSGLVPGDRVLDAGSGTGALSAEMHASGFRVTGVDPSTKSIQIAREAYSGPSFVATDMQGFSPGDHFDAVIANMSLHSVENLQTFMDSVSRNLKSDGVFLATIPNPHTYLQTRRDLDLGELDLRVDQRIPGVPFRIRNHKVHPSTVTFFHRPIRSYSIAAFNSGLQIDDFDIPHHIGPGRTRDIAILVFRHQQPADNDDHIL